MADTAEQADFGARRLDPSDPLCATTAMYSMTPLELVKEFEYNMNNHACPCEEKNHNVLRRVGEPSLEYWQFAPDRASCRMNCLTKCTKCGKEAVLCVVACAPGDLVKVDG